MQHLEVLMPMPYINSKYNKPSHNWTNQVHRVEAPQQQHRLVHQVVGAVAQPARQGHQLLVPLIPMPSTIRCLNKCNSTWTHTKQEPAVVEHLDQEVVPPQEVVQALEVVPALGVLVAQQVEPLALAVVALIQMPCSNKCHSNLNKISILSPLIPNMMPIHWTSSK